jgi:hypothetical protein
MLYMVLCFDSFMITAADLHPFMISFSRIASRKRREREAEQNCKEAKQKNSTFMCCCRSRLSSIGNGTRTTVQYCTVVCSKKNMSYFVTQSLIIARPRSHDLSCLALIVAGCARQVLVFDLKDTYSTVPLL